MVSKGGRIAECDVGVWCQFTSSGWDGVGGEMVQVWFCFLQRPRLIAVCEVRVLSPQ